jgi:hypothetical protein
VSSLYRCRVRVAYKPYDYDKLIVFDEKQVAEAEVNLKWDSTSAFANNESLTNTPAFTSSLANSTCRVTINDPYMTGIAWPVLYDSASLYMDPGKQAAKAGLLLPPCEPGQDEARDKCRKYADIDNAAQPFVSGTDKFPHLLISMWYDVGGTKFGTDFYFRVTSMSITHGSSFPTVQMMGQETRAIVFNQSLVNYGFEEGTTFEKGIEKVVKDYGYTPSFCSTDYSKGGFVQPSTTRESGLTPHEVIKRRLNAVGGNMLTMPTREWSDKVSICTRAEVNQGCKVFYLGVGLYEGYTMDGVPNAQFALSNLENGPGAGSSINNNAIYTYPVFESDEYNLSDTLFKKLRETRLKPVKKNPFTGQFKALDKKFSANQATSGLYWEGAGPKVKNVKGDKINFYGVNPTNNLESIAYLDGLVKVADRQSGTVQILTKYFIYACGKQKGSSTSKCFSSPIYQEVNNLTEVLVDKSKQFDEKTYVKMGQVIGKSKKDKPDFVRFFINGQGTGTITLPAEIVYKYAIPEEGLSPEEFRKYVGDKVSSNSSANVGFPGLSPKSNRGSITATINKNAPKILLMAGHYDSQTSAPGAPSEPGGKGVEYKANKYALDWVQANAASYGVANVFEYYVPSSAQINDTGNSNSQFSRTAAAVAKKYQVIELHHDGQDASYTGNSGVIPPIPGKTIYPLDVALSQVYGSFGTNWRRDGGDLGIPKRGGTILEIAALTPANAARALSTDKAVRDAYYKQALDPFMRSVYNQYSKGGQVTTPSSSATASTPSTSDSGGSPLTVGLVGNTGRSTGPHLHVQWYPQATVITPEDVDKYIQIGGKKPSEWKITDTYGKISALRGNRPHGGIDYAGNGIEGKPVTLVNGTKYVDKDLGYGGGFGNTVQIEVPGGRRMLLAHLMDGSIPPNIKSGQTGGSSSGSNRFNSGLTTGPTTYGLNISTSFKGVPRALRIVPGRTILSFITDYDKWLEEGKPRNIDPGVWIPERFSKFFINGCTLKWRGDLRVEVKGILDWGMTRIETPTFNQYLEEYQKDTAVVTKDYYGYIRSPGDLCYKVGGKDSCETICNEIQAIERFLNTNREAAQNSPSMSTNFGPSNCRYNGPDFEFEKVKISGNNINNVMRALQSIGITSQVAVSGVLGNLLRESYINPDIHNTPIQGFTCRTRDDGTGPREKCYGLIQWGGSRQRAVRSECERNPGLQCQLSFMLKELKTSYYSKAVEGVNNSTTPEQAAKAWNQYYEIGKENDRPALARFMYNKLKCNKP